MGVSRGYMFNYLIVIAMCYLNLCPLDASKRWESEEYVENFLLGNKNGQIKEYVEKLDSHLKNLRIIEDKNDIDSNLMNDKEIEEYSGYILRAAKIFDKFNTIETETMDCIKVLKSTNALLTRKKKEEEELQKKKEEEKKEEEKTEIEEIKKEEVIEDLEKIEEKKDPYEDIKISFSSVFKEMPKEEIEKWLENMSRKLEFKSLPNEYQSNEKKFSEIGGLNYVMSVLSEDRAIYLKISSAISRQVVRYTTIIEIPSQKEEIQTISRAEIINKNHQEAKELKKKFILSGEEFEKEITHYEDYVSKCVLKFKEMVKFLGLG